MEMVIYKTEAIMRIEENVRVIVEPDEIEYLVREFLSRNGFKMINLVYNDGEYMYNFSQIKEFIADVERFKE
jgi:hypothetical protein